MSAGDVRRSPGLDGTTAVRRDRLVAWACAWLVLLQLLPYVALGCITDGEDAAREGALYALSPSVLLGVVGFGVVLAVALTRPGLQPQVETGAVVGGRGAGPFPPPGPLLSTRSTWWAALGRLRWAALASLAEAAVFVGAIVLESAAVSGTFSVGDAVDDESAFRAYVALVIQVLVMNLRGPVAFVVALVTLRRARRPASPRWRRSARHDPSAPQAARTTRRSPDRPPG